MALDASKNNRVLEKKTSVLVYSDLYDIGKSLTEEEIIKFISFENFLIKEFLGLSKSSQTKKIKQFEKEFESDERIFSEDEKKELCKELYPHINKGARYKYECIESYNDGIVVFYYDEEKGIKNKFDITYKEHQELKKILKLKHKDMEKKLREFVSNNKDDKSLGKNLLNKINITIELLSQKNK